MRRDLAQVHAELVLEDAVQLLRRQVDLLRFEDQAQLLQRDDSLPISVDLLKEQPKFVLLLEEVTQEAAVDEFIVFYLPRLLLVQLRDQQRDLPLRRIHVSQVQAPRELVCGNSPCPVSVVHCQRVLQVLEASLGYPRS